MQAQKTWTLMKVVMQWVSLLPFQSYWTKCPVLNYDVVVSFPEHTKHSGPCPGSFPNLKQQDAVGCSGSLMNDTKDYCIFSRETFCCDWNPGVGGRSKWVHVHFHGLKNHPECPSRHQYAHCFWMLTGCQPLRLLTLKCSWCALETPKEQRYPQKSLVHEWTTATI